jgi:hypothetical protein
MKLIAYFLLIFYSASIFANDTLRAQLAPLNGEKITISQGEPFKGQLRIWPILIEDVNSFLSLEETEIMNVFYLSEILSIKKSKNNLDVVTIDGIFVLTKPFKQSEILNWNYKALNIPFKLIDIEVNPKGYQLKGMSLFSNNFKLDGGFNWKYFFVTLISIMLLAMVGFIITKYLKKKKRKAEFEVKINHWKEILKNSNARVDFESLYKKRIELKKIIKGNNEKDLDDFFLIVNKYQYKKDWSTDELEELSNELNKIELNDGLPS